MYRKALPQCEGSISKEQFLGAFHVIEIHFDVFEESWKGSGRGGRPGSHLKKKGKKEIITWFRF